MLFLFIIVFFVLFFSTVLSRPSDIPWPYDLNGALQNFKKTNVHKMDSERALLNYLLTKLYKIDADIIVGHDLSGYTIELLVSRLSLHKVPNWSRLSRLKRSVIPSSKVFKAKVSSNLLICFILLNYLLHTYLRIAVK